MYSVSIRKVRVLLLRLFAIPFILLAVFVRPSWPTESQTGFSVEFVGYIFLLAGLAIRIWSILYVGGRKSHQLVTDGPYSICRNPLYIGTFILAVGTGLCFENIPMLAAILLVFVPVHLVVVRLEEKHLETLFPTEYALYKQKVPRFRPSLRNFKQKKEVVVSVRAIRRIMVDTIAVLMIPQIEDFLEVLQANSVIPVLWHFP